MHLPLFLGTNKIGEKRHPLPICWWMWKELFRLSEDEHLGPAAEETLGFMYQQHEVLNPQAFLCRAWGLDSDVGCVSLGHDCLGGLCNVARMQSLFLTDVPLSRKISLVTYFHFFEESIW